MKQSVTIYLPFKVSTNSIYSQKVKWQKRSEHKDLMLWAFYPVADQLKPVDKCKLLFEFRFKSKILDCDNCSYMMKMCIDSLTYFGIIKDDNPNIVKYIGISSKKGKEDEVEIVIDDCVD